MNAKTYMTIYDTFYTHPGHDEALEILHTIMKAEVLNDENIPPANIRELINVPQIKEEILSGRALSVLNDSEMERLMGNIEAILFHREQTAINEHNQKIAKQALGLTDQDIEVIGMIHTMN